jgi:hypothetical protein
LVLDGESLPESRQVLIFEGMNASLRLLTIFALSAGLEASAQDPFNDLMGLILEDLMGRRGQPHKPVRAASV